MKQIRRYKTYKNTSKRKVNNTGIKTDSWNKQAFVQISTLILNLKGRYVFSA